MYTMITTMTYYDEEAIRISQRNLKYCWGRLFES